MDQRSGGNQWGLQSRTAKAQAMPATTAAARASRGKNDRRRGPQGRGAHADQRADGRGQGHRVVRVDDPLGEAEDQRRDEQPAAPQQDGGARAVGPRRPAASARAGATQRMSAAGSSQRDLAAQRRR